MAASDIFMTGGTGLIGRWTAAHLTKSDQRVFILVRGAAGRLKDFQTWIADHGGNPDLITFIEGDLGSPNASISQADKARLLNVERVYHLGASFDWGLKKEFARRINVQGTGAILELAKSLPKLKRFVLVSGYMVASAERWAPFGIEKPDDLKAMTVTDQQIARMYRELGSYEASKLEADILTRQYCQDNNLPLTIINPSTVIGHSETGELDQTQGLGAIIQSVWKKFFSAVPGKKEDWIPLISIDYVSEFLARSPELADTLGAEYTLLDQATPRFDELASLIAWHMGRTPPARHIPKALMKFLLNLGLGKIMGTSAESLSFLEPFHFDTAPAEQIAKKLNLAKPDIRQTIRKTVDQLVVTHFGEVPPAFPVGQFKYHEIAGTRTLAGGDFKAADHVFLHGLPLNADSWAPLLQDYHCNPLLADLPGVSRSTSRFDVNPSEWVNSLCDQLEHPPIIVAHSLGTAYALEYAAAHPDRVAGLVLIAPYFLQKPAARSVKFRFSVDDVNTMLSDAKPASPSVVSSTFHNFKIPGMLMRAGKILGQSRKSSHRSKYQALLEKVEAPILIISGNDDPLVETLSNIPVIELQGGGHYPQLTHPTEVSKLIEEFAQSIDSDMQQISA